MNSSQDDRFFLLQVASRCFSLIATCLRVPSVSLRPFAGFAPAPIIREPTTIRRSVIRGIVFTELSTVLLRRVRTSSLHVTGMTRPCQFSQADVATTPPIFNADHFSLFSREGDPQRRGGVADALIDLCVVAIGTLDVFKVTAIRAWDGVHAANMNEVGSRRAGRTRSACQT